MNAYAVAPLIATIAYIPVLVFTAGSRPWHKRNLLFILFLISAMTWSLVVYLFRSNMFPSLASDLFKYSMILFSVTAVQFHVFLSSFYPKGNARWLLFSYITLAPIIVLVLLGYVTSDAIQEGLYVHGSYKIGITLVAGLLLTIGARNFYVFGSSYRHSDNAVIRNQAFTLLVSVSILMVFSVVSIPSWFNAFPFAHYGNLLVAVILSYAVVRHRLVDIKIVLRKGAAWMAFAITGIVVFWFILLIVRSLKPFQLDYPTLYLTSSIAVFVVIFLFKIQGPFFELVTRAFAGSRYEIRRRLDEFTDKIHNVFSLKQQGSELLDLLIRSINVTQACLMFPEAGSDEYTAHFSEPHDKPELGTFQLQAGDLIVNYLKREHSILLRDDLETLPAFLGMWAQEREEIRGRDISMFVPLISRDQLIAILVLGPKVSGRFNLEDYDIIRNVTTRVAVSMEKEYLREQLREREEELSVINNSSVILSSSLEIQDIFGSFIDELKKVVDVAWASIVLEQETELRCAAVSSPEHSDYKVGDVIPREGSGVGWVVANRRKFIEADLNSDNYFDTGESHRSHGLRTLAYLPLIAKGRIIGVFIVASTEPNAYTHRHLKLLEQLASQIAMPLENTQLYARAEKKARVDELTGLLNRRSLDEMLDSEISRHSRYGGEFALAILDLDNFKVYNDTYGHLSGDELLREIGGRIKSSIRGADSAFRYGGDEFAIVLPHTDIESARQVAERVGHRIASGTNAGELTITASIGIAVWPQDGISHSDIITAADITLYHAKRGGGDRTITASSVAEAGALSGPLGSRERSGDDRTLDVASVLAQTVDGQSQSSRDHSLKVCKYAVMLGRELQLGSGEVDNLQTAALLHDIGKLAISEEIWNKPGELTPEEWEIVRTHSRIGASIVSNIPQASHCKDAVLSHHEWFDGSGYPDGLSGEAIPLQARILSIADAFAAMTDIRSYAAPVSPARALRELEKHAGKQFDPELVAVFVAAYEKQHAGTEQQVRR